MRFVSPFLKRAVYPALHRTGWLNRVSPSGGYAVVNYHGLLPAGSSGDAGLLEGSLVAADAFRAQMKFLNSHYRVIHPQDFRSFIEEGRPLPPRSVMVTCDDGLRNHLTEMLPILQEESVPCLFFVTGYSCSGDPGMLWYQELFYLLRNRPLGEVDSRLPQEEEAQHRPQDLPSRWWSAVRRASRLEAEARESWMAEVREHCGPLPAGTEKRWGVMKTRELKQLCEAGMTIGAHTRTHPILSLCSDEQAIREIQQVKNEMERVLGRAIWAFAYPFGNPQTLGEREFRIAKQAGFSCGFVNVEHWGGIAAEFAIPRTHVTLDMTLPEYAAHLSGFHSRLQRAVAG